DALPISRPVDLRFGASCEVDRHLAEAGAVRCRLRISDDLEELGHPEVEARVPLISGHALHPSSGGRAIFNSRESLQRTDVDKCFSSLKQPQFRKVIKALDVLGTLRSPREADHPLSRRKDQLNLLDSLLIRDSAVWANA